MQITKRHKEIERLVTESGLSLVEFGISGSGHISFIAQAPNGERKKFSCSKTPSTWTGDKNQQQWLRRFAKENTPSKLEDAISRALPQMDSEGPPIKVPLYAFAPKEPEPSATVAAPPAPTVTPEPASPTTTKPTMTTKPTIKKRQTTHIEFFQLCEWIKTAELGGVFSISQCAEKASAALGFPVPNSAIESAISATGVKLPDRPEHAGKRDRVQIVAKELADLMRHLGQTPSADLMSVINRTGA